MDEFLLARALEHDSPLLLFRLACEYLISARVIRPGPVTVVERVAHAREEARRETFDRLAHEFTEQRCAALDGLLVTDPEVAATRLQWLSTGPVEASPSAVKAEVAKLEFLRGMDAHTLDLSMLAAERRRFLATVGRRSTAQALARREPQRRHPILLTLVAQSATDVLDEVVQLFDQAVSARESKAAHKMRDALAERGRSGEDRQALLDAVLAIVADPGIPDERVGGLIRGEKVGWERLRAAHATALPRLPRDHGHLAALDGSYGYLWQFTPHVLDAVRFAGGTAATDTHGVTLVNFALFDLLGLKLSPRIRDLGKITLYRAGQKSQVESDFPLVGPLLTRRLTIELVAGHYDDLLRLAGALKFGHASASLLVGKLSASGRQNTLAAALKEYGALRRTIYAARYLSDSAYRRKISRQLNKGESLHALKRDLLYAHEGTVRARHLEQQTEQAWCLTLATNAVVAWTTEYYGLALDSMRAAGRRVDDEVLAHISPAHSANINRGWTRAMVCPGGGHVVGTTGAPVVDSGLPGLIARARGRSRRPGWVTVQARRAGTFRRHVGGRGPGVG